LVTAILSDSFLTAATPSTPTRHPASQSTTSPLTIQFALLEAEREASESALLQVIDSNNRLMEENAELQKTIVDLNRRIQGMPEAVKDAVAKFLSTEIL
jgi:predicted  nucleic acid-binding Zn-ribbon protein